MKTKVYDYLEIYRFAKEHGRDAACAEFGISRNRLNAAIVMGDDFIRERPVPANAKTLDKFAPRELMEELARRGYTGKLSYTKTVDITNF